MKKTPVFDSETPSGGIRYVSTDISDYEVYYSNELAFSEHKYNLKEEKILDIVSSQLSIHPLYDDKAMSIDKEGNASIDFDYLTHDKLIECFDYKESRTIYISNKVLCDYLGLDGKISRIPNLNEFKEKHVTLNKKLFPGDTNKLETEQDIKTEKSIRETFKPFQDVIVRDGYIEFIFNSNFVPYVIGVHGFKKYNLDFIQKLKHNLSLRLLKLINYYHHHGGYAKARYSKAFDMVTFKRLLGDIPNSYRTKPTLLFNKGVNPALEEIAKVTGIHYKAEIFSFPNGKKGRPSISSVRLVPLPIEETNLNDTQEGVNQSDKLSS